MKNSTGLVVALTILLVPGCSSMKKKTEKSNTPPSNVPVGASPKTDTFVVLTIDIFNAIETDMTYEEVVKILGSDGTLARASEIGGLRLVSYKWEGENFKRVFCSFRNNRLTGKSQSGLSDASSAKDDDAESGNRSTKPSQK